MISLLLEQRIPLNALAKRELVHPSTVHRWRLRGRQGHKLETFVVGGRRYTTLPAFERWLAKINGGNCAPNPIPTGRELDIAAAERELDGLLNQ